MPNQLRSGKVLRSPKAAKSPKRRIVSIDDDFVPGNSPNRVFHPTSDPTYRPGKGSFSPIATPTRTSRINKKSKPKNAHKPTPALKAAVEQEYCEKCDGPCPEIVKRRRSSVAAGQTSIAPSNLLGAKKVSFHGDLHFETSTPALFEYAEPLGTAYKTPLLYESYADPEVVTTPVEALRNTKILEPHTASPKIKKPSTEPTQEVPAINWAQVDEEARGLLLDLLETPTAISLNDISACFCYLQIETRQWTNEHFKFDLLKDDVAQDAWPLQLLKTKYRPLFLTTQYIADGSQYGWRHFFTQPESRSSLVYGIVGEYVKYSIFGHTAFGFPKDQVAELEKIDKREIHQDGFLRNKMKAEMMYEYFSSKSNEEREVHLTEQVENLADVLLTVIEPLLPTEIFDYDSHKDQWYLKDDSESHEKREKIRDGLIEIIEQCVALHWAIRLRGEDGTIVRIAPAVQKGEQYHETAPFLCINPQMMSDTAHHGGDEKGRVKKIKMTCWGRAEAYIPHGRNQVELAEIEYQYRLHHGMLNEDVEMTDEENDMYQQDDELDWDKVDAWYYKYHKEHVNPDAPESVKYREMRKLGKTENEMQGWRTPYVSQHKFLSRHDVYCEWEPADKPEFNFNTKIEEVDAQPANLSGKTARERQMDLKYGLPIPKGERVTLARAVEQARKEVSVFKHTFEDMNVGLRKHLNRHWWKYELAVETALGLIVPTVLTKTAMGISWDDLLRKIGASESAKLLAQQIHGAPSEVKKTVTKVITKVVESFWNSGVAHPGSGKKSSRLGVGKTT